MPEVFPPAQYFNHIHNHIYDNIGVRGGGGSAATRTGLHFWTPPQTRGCVRNANQREALADVASPRVRPPGSSPRAPQPGVGSELWFLSSSCAVVVCVVGSRGRVPAPGAENRNFHPKSAIWGEMVEFHENDGL